MKNGKGRKIKKYLGYIRNSVCNLQYLSTDQQRVLQRSEHVFELEDRCSVIFVRESLENDTSHLTSPTSALAEVKFIH